MLVEDCDLLVGDIDSGGCHIKLFPRTFVVRDACVTNADGIWLTKHVWL
jgi:hypothetical protein